MLASYLLRYLPIRHSCGDFFSIVRKGDISSGVSDRGVCGSTLSALTMTQAGVLQRQLLIVFASEGTKRETKSLFKSLTNGFLSGSLKWKRRKEGCEKKR